MVHRLLLFLGGFNCKLHDMSRLLFGLDMYIEGSIHHIIEHMYISELIMTATEQFNVWYA